MSAEARESKFLPVFFLPVVERGAEFAPDTLPLHITLFPPLRAPYDRRFGDELRTQLNQHEPFIVKTAGEAYYGPNEDIPTRLLEPSLSMHGMHAMVELAIGTLLHDETYRRPYRPHISVNDFSDVPRNQSIFVAGLSIVEKISGHNWVVVDKVGLKGERHEA
jgi:hypothetical protein